MHLRVKIYIQLISFIANLKNVIYYQNVLIIPAALSRDHLFNYQLSPSGKRFKEKFYLFTSRFFPNFNLKLTF
jgi:hypothetical protein